MGPIRRAQPADAEAIAALINLAFQVERFFIDGDRIGLEQVRDLLTTGEFLVEEEGGALAACVYVELRGERAYLGLLSVGPALQGRGVGSRLVAAAEEHCRGRGCRFLDLQIVNLREELPEFYRRRGYVAAGMAPFPSGVPTKLPCHFVKMSKPL
ncbi:MAG: GNAT family N-acetyltransferase [Acidobacteriia bacterium]|nr:GNAT family N-acetyltransferase [Terriglobia bacterium]